jgi:hypothetical protein
MIAISVGLFNISPLSGAVDGEHFFLGGGGTIPEISGNGK